MAEQYLKKGDTFPAFESTLSDNNGPIDLTDATIKMRMSLPGPAGTLLDVVASVKYPSLQSDITKRGIVYYQWVSGDTNETGDHNVEWRITFLDGRKATVPRGKDQSFDIVHIQEEVV